MKISNFLYKITSAYILIFLSIFLLSSCSSKTEPVVATNFFFNTTCTIEIRDMDNSKADKVINDAFDECTRYEKLFSRTLEGSDIYKLNHAGGKPVTVSDETIEMLNFSIETSKSVDGKFDISVGKLTDLWNFTAENPRKPSDDKIRKFTPHVGYQNIKINGNEVTLTDSETWLDLGAVAKGYIADKLDAFLRSKGVKSAIINLGGNLSTIGYANGDTPWSIGIERPYSDRSEVIGAIELTDNTVVTSGIYERHFVENGIDYHHILNPLTGFPTDTDIISISIFSANGNSMLCDVYATTCLLLGKEDAIRFMSGKDGFEYLILDKSDNITKSDGFNLIDVK